MVSKPSGARGRPKLSEDGVDRKSKILDAAEALLCVHGFHGVTVREVAAQAEVDPAMINYFFDSKQGLFNAVIGRRSETINARRLESMIRYEGSTPVMTVEGCLASFFDPTFYLLEFGGIGWKNYLRLIAILNNSPAWGEQAINEFFDPVIQHLIAMLRKALPEARDEDLYWSYHFISGAQTLAVADTGRIDTLSGGLCRSSDFTAIRKRFAFFLAVGTSELCRRMVTDT
jgi:AcrR family transcriptional regulator